MISVIAAIIMKMTSGSGTIDEDGSTIDELPGMIDNGESKNEEDASMISKIVIKIGVNLPDSRITIIRWMRFIKYHDKIILKQQHDW